MWVNFSAYPGLPDGIHIFKPKITICVNIGGPWNGKIGIFYAHLEHIMTIWYIVWQFGIFMAIWYIYGNLVYLWQFGTFMAIWYILWQFSNVVSIWYIFPRFGVLCEEKSGIPGRTRKNRLFVP
jgi:hypothetical protein